MKIGPGNPFAEVPLPTEVLHIVLQFVRQIRDGKRRTRTLWSFCLVSKNWYTIGISALYEAPLLNNKNFDLFARTICPPVNAHVRRVGLENLVKRLYMGTLAYESQKTLTARLLRRTRDSLEAFVAPAISFSITALAPLSRCLELRSLDLSRDSYDIDLGRLLHSIQHHKKLLFLSLPQRAMSMVKGRSWPIFPVHCAWPPNLKYLQTNYEKMLGKDYWTDLIRSWPTSLSRFSYQDPLTYTDLQMLEHTEAVAEFVTNLELGAGRHEDSGYIRVEWLLHRFPNITTLTLPVKDVCEVDNHLSESRHLGKFLEEIIFVLPPSVYPAKTDRAIDLIGNYVDAFPRLKRIEVPASCLPLDDDRAMADLDTYEYKMVRRKIATDTGFAGILLVEE